MPDFYRTGKVFNTGPGADFAQDRRQRADEKRRLFSSRPSPTPPPACREWPGRPGGRRGWPGRPGAAWCDPNTGLTSILYWPSRPDQAGADFRVPYRSVDHEGQGDAPARGDEGGLWQICHKPRMAGPGPRGRAAPVGNALPADDIPPRPTRPSRFFFSTKKKPAALPRPTRGRAGCALNGNAHPHAPCPTPPPAGRTPPGGKGGRPRLAGRPGVAWCAPWGQEKGMVANLPPSSEGAAQACGDEPRRSFLGVGRWQMAELPRTTRPSRMCAERWRTSPRPRGRHFQGEAGKCRQGNTDNGGGEGEHHRDAHPDDPECP
jgi:hypothetical protein